MKILIINGPNLNMLGKRQPEIYGHETLSDLSNLIAEYCDKKGYDVFFFQSNHEGEIIDRIHKMDYDCCVINPGAYTHYSYAIADAIGSVPMPFAEVHISDINSREDFRKISVTKPYCVHQISGHGFQGYVQSVDFLEKYIKNTLQK